MDEKKIQLIFEALNKTKGAFTELENSLKGVSGGQKKLNAENQSLVQTMKQNWLGLTAAVGAATLTIKKAWDFMELGSKADQAEQSFRSVAAAAGESADGILEAMKRAAAGTVDDSDIMQKAVKGMTQGLSGDQLVGIMEAARVAARTTGESVTTTYEAITDAIANKMPRTLQRYGLVTKEQVKLLNEAMALGITEVDLYALAMENAGGKLGQLGELQDTNAEKMQRWKAMFNDIRESIGNGLFWIMDNVIDPLIKGFEQWAVVAARAVSKVGAVWDWVTSGFKGGVAGIKREFANLETAFDEQMAEIEKKHGKSAARTGSNGASKPSASGGGKGAFDQLKDIRAMKAREAEIQRELAQLDIAERDREISHADAARERLRLEEKLLATQQANLAPINDLNARAAKEKEIDDTIRKISELKLAVRELNGTFTEGMEEGLKRYLDQAKSVFQLGVQLAQEAAQAMESAFGDFFFDAMSGKLKSLGDYITSFLQAVQRALANVLAQQAAQGIASALAGAFSGGGSSGYTTTGDNTGYVNMVPPPKHSGGFIMHQGGYVPRFHFGGLMPDERPAILQTGEGVLSRRGMAALDALNNGNAGGGGMSVVVQVENRSSQPVKATQGPVQFDGKRVVAGVILEDLEHGGPIRTAIEGLRK